jgi:hypothetical protein
VANRSPTPASNIGDFLGLFDDIWEVRGRLTRPIWGIPGVRAGIQKYILIASKRQPRIWMGLRPAFGLVPPGGAPLSEANRRSMAPNIGQGVRGGR